MNLEEQNRRFQFSFYIFSLLCDYSSKIAV
jgi:hypothetical protein